MQSITLKRQHTAWWTLGEFGLAFDVLYVDVDAFSVFLLAKPIFSSVFLLFFIFGSYIFILRYYILVLLFSYRFYPL